MTTYAWPVTAGWVPSRFELRVLPNTRAFVGPYTPTTQVIDLMGERWQARISLAPDESPIVGAAREAFFDRLKGPANLTSLWHFKLTAPQGTLRATDSQTVLVQNSSLATVTVQNSTPTTINVVTGTPVLKTYIAQGANTATVGAIIGKTVRAGDMLGMGAQLVRMMADATADGSGNLAIEFQPRARSDIAAYTALVTDKPSANFMLKADGVPTSWEPGFVDGAELELVEVY